MSATTSKSVVPSPGLRQLREIVERLEAKDAQRVEHERPKLTLINGGRDAG